MKSKGHPLGSHTFRCFMCNSKRLLFLRMLLKKTAGLLTGVPILVNQRTRFRGLNVSGPHEQMAPLFRLCGKRIKVQVYGLDHRIQLPAHPAGKAAASLYLKFDSSLLLCSFYESATMHQPFANLEPHGTRDRGASFVTPQGQYTYTFNTLPYIVGVVAVAFPILTFAATYAISFSGGLYDKNQTQVWPYLFLSSSINFQPASNIGTFGLGVTLAAAAVVMALRYIGVKSTLALANEEHGGAAAAAGAGTAVGVVGGLGGINGTGGMGGAIYVGAGDAGEAGGAGSAGGSAGSSAGGVGGGAQGVEEIQAGAPSASAAARTGIARGRGGVLVRCFPMCCPWSLKTVRRANGAGVVAGLVATMGGLGVASFPYHENFLAHLTSAGVFFFFGGGYLLVEVRV